MDLDIDEINVEEKTEDNAKKKVEEKELFELDRKVRLYNNLKHRFTIFGRKYYECPLKLINDDIHLLNNDLKDLNFDIRTVVINPYDIEIKTYFNENNRDILTDKTNQTIALVCPKYQHYINYSKLPNNTFITCSSDYEPFMVKSIEININCKLYRGDNIVQEKLLF